MQTYLHSTEKNDTFYLGNCHSTFISFATIKREVVGLMVETCHFNGRICQREWHRQSKIVAIILP